MTTAQERAKLRWYQGQNIQAAIDELPPWDTRKPRPKFQIDHLIWRIRSSNAPLKEKLAALEELDG